MAKEEMYEKLTEAMIALDEDECDALIAEGVEAGLPPLDILLEGLGPGLTVLGDEFAANRRFLTDLMIAGEIMNGAMKRLLPSMDDEAAIVDRKPGEHVMVVGTVEGDLHNLGKRIVTAFFAGAGIRSVDIGENKSADDFLAAIKKYKPDIVGASAIIGPVTPYCRTIHEAMVEAGVRDDVIYITGGWDMSPVWCDEVGADAYGENAQEALENVRALLSGEMPRWKDRVRGK